MISEVSKILMCFYQCFSRGASFYWFVITIVGLIIRLDHHGISSISRWLGLKPNLYVSFLNLFRASSWKLENIQQCWLTIVRSRCPTVTIEDREKSKRLDFTRFLILPWVKVPHLASHLLANIAKRISGDWVNKYGHPLYMLETFVEQFRFRGICYRAANWVHVGQTQGRSRNDTHRTLQVPIKEVYLYPLIRNVQEVLTHES